MIGNDIVDLKRSTFNWKRPRFLDKVFTENEQTIIFSSTNKHELLWLLWSMKEAAYKCHVQQFGKRFFNPKRLLCKLISEDKGIVKIDDNSYFTRSTITEDYVYTIAKPNTNTSVNSSVVKTEDLSFNIQSDSLKQDFLNSISQNKGLDIQTLNIKKTAIGIPELFNNDEKLSVCFSLTHCGRFSGFVYEIN